MLGAFDTWDLAHTQAEYVAKLKQPYIKQGLIPDDGGYLGSGGTFESGHLGYLEGIILNDPSNPQSSVAARELVETGVRDVINLAMGFPTAAFGVEAKRVFGPACTDHHVWLGRIKAALDPDRASDSFFYAEGKTSHPWDIIGKNIPSREKYRSSSFRGTNTNPSLRGFFSPADKIPHQSFLPNPQLRDAPQPDDPLVLPRC